MKRLQFILLALLALPSCKEEENIPGRVDDGGKETGAVYNDLGFTPHKDGEPYDTYEGLIMAGYQGWFGCPGDGCSGVHGKCFYHYQENGMFKPGPLRNSIDFWPDMTEYEKTYKTDFKFDDGSPAYVYSAYDESSVMLHFKWMKEYGIDGVFMQRFVGEVIGNSSGKDHFDKVLSHAMKASNKYERAISFAYDLSGGLMYNGRTVDMVVADAKAIMDKYNLKDRNAGQKYYLYENGKPLVCVWGVGFSDNRKYTVADCAELVEKLQGLGYSVLLGVPTYWRALKTDCLSDNAIHDLIKKCDAVFPWFVGRYNGSNYGSFKSNIKSDIDWCKTNKVVYAPLCYPGFSWENMNPTGTSTIARKKGDFLWTQLYNCIYYGAKCIYIAMFDEIDEGTAIYKTMRKSEAPSNVPEDKYYVVYKGGSWSISNTEVTGLSGSDWCKLGSEVGTVFQGVEDGLETDHYLYLVGQAGKMLRGEIPMQSKQPSR